MAVIDKNRTRYSTTDLLNLLNWFEDRMRFRFGGSHNDGGGPTASVRDKVPEVLIWEPPKTVSVSTISPSNVLVGKGVKLGVRQRHSRHNHSPDYHRTKEDVNLKLVAPKNLPDDDDPGRTAIHAWKDNRGILPISVTKDILRWYYSNGKMSYSNIQAFHDKVIDLIDKAREGNIPQPENKLWWGGLPPVYVDVRVADPTKSKKSTPDREDPTVQKYAR